MRYRISEIRIDAKQYADREHRMEHLRRALEKKLPRRCGEISDIEIIRESIDARRRPDVKAVYTLDFECPGKLSLPEGAPAGYNSRYFEGGFRQPRDLHGRREQRETGASRNRDAESTDESRRAQTIEPCTIDPRAIAPCTAETKGTLNVRTDGPRPVIAGFGPCGIFAALTLARAGLSPIVLERGRAVEDRMRDVERFWRDGILDPESNVQFGEGGAGTFSDGKLTTGIRDPRIRQVLVDFVTAGADPAILYQQKPHIGTDVLRRIVPELRREIQRLGGEIRFGAKLAGLECRDGKLAAVLIEEVDRQQTERAASAEGPDSRHAEQAADCERGADGVTCPQPMNSAVPRQMRIPASELILAIGHSARDTFGMLRDLGLPMEQKAFSIGVRIEHPQERIDAAQYGDASLAEVFGPAAYKLHYRCESGRGVYTFCMCPGGRVINASSETQGAVTNGMSESTRDSGTANSGLLVDVRPSDFSSDDPLAGVEFQRRYERLAQEKGRTFDQGLPRTDYGRFRKDPQDIVRQCLPAFAGEAILEAMPHLGRKLKGFDAEDAVMTAVETRSSSPVRILRNEDMQTSIRGIIPAGEGPGYAGGIMSAAVDGIRAAQQIIRMRGTSIHRETETTKKWYR